MSESAAHLVDHVFPHVPVRQWVLTLPFDLRARVAYEPKLRRLILRSFIRVLFSWLRRRARAQGVAEPRCGSVTFEQRFSSDLRLNLHFHVLALDGVFSESGAEPLFYAVEPPNADDLDRLVQKVHHKVLQALLREGWVDEEGRWAAPAEERSLELEFAAASVPASVGSICTRQPPCRPLIAPRWNASANTYRVRQ